MITSCSAVTRPAGSTLRSTMYIVFCTQYVCLLQEGVDLFFVPQVIRYTLQILVLIEPEMTGMTKSKECK